MWSLAAVCVMHGGSKTELQYKVEGYRYIPSIIRIQYTVYCIAVSKQMRTGEGREGGGGTQRWSDRRFATSWISLLYYVHFHLGVHACCGTNLSSPLLPSPCPFPPPSSCPLLSPPPSPCPLLSPPPSPCPLHSPPPSPLFPYSYLAKQRLWIFAQLVLGLRIMKMSTSVCWGLQYIYIYI
jgi:hypothetical protein